MPCIVFGKYNGNTYMKTRVLFVCSHNSARSQMAEEFLRKNDNEKFEVESAGLEPGEINPFVAKVLLEDEAIDITSKKTRSVFDLFKNGRKYHYVITVCDESQSDRCPIFPGKTLRRHWSFPDPAAFQGTDDEILREVRKVKDAIKKAVADFANESNYLKEIFIK